MFRRLFLVTLVLVLSIGITFDAGAETNVPITRDMQSVDSLDGVIAYYRNASIDDDGKNPTYSCAFFAKRYFSAVYGVSLSNLDTNLIPQVSKGTLTVVSTPRKGDLAFWSGKPHSAIVKSVSGSTVTLIEQNWKRYVGNKLCAVVNRTISKTSSGVKFYRWTAPATSSSPVVGDVVFYQNADQTGWSLSRTANYYANTVTVMGFANDQLSCVKIYTSGVVVEVFEHDQYRGKSVKFTAKGVYQLPNYGFNDLCSSYKVYKANGSTTTQPNTTTASVTFYGDRDGKGWSVTKAVGTNAVNAGALGFGNDDLSSIRIPAISGGKITVVVYENDNYSGRSYSFSGEGLYNLQPFDFDNKCSSYKIYK